MTHLFISHSQDDADHARSIATEIEGRGFTVWMDGGDEYPFGVNSHAIRGCAACVVIMTANAQQSEWVEMEMLIAKKFGKPIFSLEGESLPSEDFFVELAKVAPVTAPGIEGQITQLLDREIRAFSQSLKMFGPSWAIGIVRIWAQHIPGKGQQVIAYIMRVDVLNQELPEMERDGWESFRQQLVKQWVLNDDPRLPGAIAKALITANERLGIGRDDIQIEDR
jgi:hypothetical protein